jgi:VCBS repeat protein
MESKTSFRLVLSLSVLCTVLSLAQGAQVQHALSLVSPVSPTGIPQFAIGDFDGDRKPDLAEVQVDRTDSQATQYSIQVHLTSGASQSIGVTAPFGGLQIEPRDVNGDNAPDLIVSTAFQHEPVAVFLNDGQGNFTRAEPTAFPEAFIRSDTAWSSYSNPPIDAVVVAPLSNIGICRQSEALHCFRLRADLIPDPNPGFLPNSFLTSHAGRAPPSVDPIC